MDKIFYFHRSKQEQHKAEINLDDRGVGGLRVLLRMTGGGGASSASQDDWGPSRSHMTMASRDSQIISVSNPTQSAVLALLR